MFDYTEWLKQMQSQQGQSQYDMQSQQLQPAAENTAGDQGIKTAASTIGSAWGPVGAGVGAVVGKLLASQGRDNKGLGETFVKGAAMNYLGGEASQAAGDAFGQAATETANKTVENGGNSLLADASAKPDMATNYSLGTGQLQVDNTLGDIYNGHDAVGTLNSASDITNTTNNYPSFEMQDSLAATPTFGEQAFAFAKDQLKGASRGLIGGEYKPQADTGMGAIANFGQGFFKGGQADTTIANLGDGNFAGALGGTMRLGYDNYRPPVRRRV